MTLAVYPLVYLPVAASLRSADPGQEEVARSLGVGRVAHVRAGHARPGPRRDPRRLPAGRAGPAGRVRRVRDPRLPDVHHRDLHRVPRSFNLPAACALSLVLVRSACSCWPARALLARPRRPGRPVRPAGRAGQPPQRLGRATLAGAGRLFVAAGRARARRAGRHARLLDGRTAGRHAVRQGVARCSAPPGTPPGYGGSRGGPGHRRWRCRSRCSRSGTPGRVAAAARAQHLPGAGHARPGDRARAVLLRERYAAGFVYQSAPLLVVCYAILFFPLALVGVKASVARAPAGLDEVGPLARPAPARGALPGHAAARLARPGRRVLPGLPVRGHRAHRHPDPDPDRRADARHPVLGVPDQPLLRPGRAVRPGDDRRRRGARATCSAGGSTASAASADG